VPRSLEKSVTEVRIVEAAVQLFARQGFKSATTREIAQLARVNEATLFRYFRRKSDLFWAAVESRLGRVKLGRDLQMSMAADEDPAIVVPGIVAFLLNSLAQQPELHRLLYVAAFELPAAEDVIREHLGAIFDLVSAYFQRCAEKGLAEKSAGAVAALGIFGTVSAHRVLSPMLTGSPASLMTDPEEAVQGYSQLWLRALRPV
jgi:AcrR family transcriptional regulator